MDDWRFLLVFLFCFKIEARETNTTASPNIVSRIAFGSCSNQSAPQPIWDAIVEFEPQLFIWLGDNIYGDNKRPFSLFGKERTIGPWKNKPRFYPSSESELRSRYHTAKSNPGYIRLREKAQVIGTWDDHDYGLNDAGKEFEGKRASQRLLLDFLDESLHSSRRKQAGVYASYMFGPEGKRVKIIVLDTRYHRDPLFSDGTILGEAQWKWLETELNGPQFELTIIASSIQVISNLSATTGPLFYLESWGRFPKERDRLFQLIHRSKRKGVMFISGDVHFGEIARYDCAIVGYPLYDITSSGLTQSVETAVPTPFAFLIRFIAWLVPNSMRVFSSNCRYSSCTYSQPNFGTIEIEWDADPTRIRVQVRDVNGQPTTGVDFLLSELQQQPLDSQFRNRNGGKDYRRHCSPETELPWLVRYRLTFLLFGVLAVLMVALVLIGNATVSVGKLFIKKFKID